VGRVPTVALVTCADLPDLDDDDRLIAPALAARGIDAVPAVWSDGAVDWDAFDLVVLRNPWDYTRHLPDFLAWAEGVPRLANPLDVIAWNTDKRYLGELAAAGLPVVDTHYLAPGEALRPFDREVVVKPTVSAGARDTERFAPGNEAAAAAHLDVIHATGRTAMVQPYLAKVAHAGETALLHVGGTYSHAIRKGPLLTDGRAMVSDLYVEEQIDPREPSDAERAAAAAIMAEVERRFGALLYARVDLLLGDDGEPALLELELTEPSLFLGTAPGAAERLADAIAARLG
jgi:glutathione synthase/RimK-type ligase-like ATP-grasp enzyme